MEKLLLVVHAEICERTKTDALLRSLRRLASSHTHILLFCDLSPSDTARRMEDEPVIRALQSGVMSMDRCADGRYMLLVREREWDDAARAYLGRAQRRDIRSIIGQLFQDGKTEISFRAASISPGSLSDRYEAVLFMDADMTCTPDTPRRMADALAMSGEDCVTAPVLPLRSADETLLTRLSRLGFSLSAPDALRQTLLKRRNFSVSQGAVMVSAAALRGSPLPPDTPCPLAAGCCFVRLSAPSLDQYLSAFRQRCLRSADAQTLLPLIQAFLLACSAVSGASWLTALSILLPEFFAVIRLRLLPSALVRTALLPLLFTASLDGLARRLLAKSPRFRVELPSAAFSPFVCTVFGGALLFAALIGVHALVPLMAISLLWLFAPLIVRALHSPAHERIPLSAQEQHAMLTQARQAFARLTDETLQSESPSLAMLAACTGCMLSELEPDEAARRVQTQFVRAQSTPPFSAHEQAAMLACAQYLRERMGECDAALRELPAQLEAFISQQPLPQENGLLSAYLTAARSRDSSAHALSSLRKAANDAAIDRLLLPLGRPGPLRTDELSLPLTHPHSYLSAGSDAASTSASLSLFLFLSAAALGHPFWPLLLRSLVTGPYAPLFSML